MRDSFPTPLICVLFLRLLKMNFLHFGWPFLKEKKFSLVWDLLEFAYPVEHQRCDQHNQLTQILRHINQVLLYLESRLKIPVFLRLCCYHSSKYVIMMGSHSDKCYLTANLLHLGRETKTTRQLFDKTLH